MWAAAAADVLLTPQLLVMTDRRAAADSMAASCRRHFRDMYIFMYNFVHFKAVHSVSVQCKHRQIMKMSSNEPTCFYINCMLLILSKNTTPTKIKQLRTDAIYQLTNSRSIKCRLHCSNRPNLCKFRWHANLFELQTWWTSIEC